MARKRKRKKSKLTKLNRQVGSRLKGLKESLELLFFELGATAEEIKEVFALESETLFATIVHRTPVKTGNLKKSWNKESAEGDLAYRVQIENGVYYLRFVENGTSRQAPKGFIRISVSEFKKVLMKALRKIRKEASK